MKGTNKIEDKEFERLREAARPLQDYINDIYGNPYAIVVVQYDRVDVYQGVLGLPTPEMIKD